MVREVDGRTTSNICIFHIKLYSLSIELKKYVLKMINKQQMLQRRLAYHLPRYQEVGAY